MNNKEEIELAIDTLNGVLELIDALVEKPEPNWSVDMLQAGVTGCCLSERPKIVNTVTRLKNILNTEGEKEK